MREASSNPKARPRLHTTKTGASDALTSTLDRQRTTDLAVCSLKGRTNGARGRLMTRSDFTHCDYSTRDTESNELVTPSDDFRTLKGSDSLQEAFVKNALPLRRSRLELTEPKHSANSRVDCSHG